MLNLFLSDFINENKLSSRFESSAVEYFIPLADRLALHQNSAEKPLFVGVNGCQGSGKSTLASFMKAYWHHQYGLNTVVISLDDFYYDQDKRAALAKDVHPLLATRGVPGTHDTQHIQTVLQQLTQQMTEVKIPRFDKANDNPLPTKAWSTTSEFVDIVVFEGWCWGVPSQPDEALKNPVNSLEQSQDIDARWRHYVNDQLKTCYQPLYQYFHRWIMLKAPAFDDVYSWRLEQEEKLRDSVAPEQGKNIMSASQVHDFIQYYQRLTDYALTTLPERCDHVFELNSDRKIINYIKNKLHD